jgi:hypothetical protein
MSRACHLATLKHPTAETLTCWKTHGYCPKKAAGAWEWCPYVHIISKAHETSGKNGNSD